MKKLLTCLLVFCTIQYTNAQSCADGSFSFDDDIAPILVANCGGCHGNGMTTGGNGGYNVFTYNNVLAGGNMCGSAVTPGDATPTASSIIDKTQWAIGNPDATCGGNMPANGIPLTMADYMAIETWIAAGAQEACPANPCDMAAVLACGDNITDSDGVEPVPAITCGAGGDGGNGFWYTFAGTGDDITIDLSASDYDTQIAVYDGTCAALNCIVGDDDSGAGTTSLATFTSTAGTDYLIYVDGFGGATGNLGLSVTCTPPPTQCTPGIADNTGVGCDNAINICGECSVSGTNVGNGPASDFCAVPACTGADGDSASWLTFVGDGGTYTFNTNGSDFDTQIAVFTDDGAGCLACEGGDDDGGLGTQSAVTIATTAGTTYFIVVDGFGANTGNWNLNVTDGSGTDGEGNAINIPCPSAPEACPQATACVPLAADATAPAAVVSSESSCQADGITTAGGVIDPITCPAGQTAEYATDGATFSTTLPVYDQLNPITVTTRCVCDSDPTDVSPTAEVVTVPDPCICTPVADPTQTAVDCANAIDICGASCEVTGTNVGNGPASDFCAVPACTGADGDSASWLTFVGDGGTYTFNTNGSDFDTQIAVFTDDGAGCLACEGGDDDGGIGTQSAVTIATTAGTTYFIVVDGFGASTGNWILNITDGTGVDGAGNPLAIACPSAPAACPAVAAACPTSDFVAPTVITSVCDGTILTYPMAGGVDFNIDDPDATQLGGMMWFDANDPTTANPVTTTDPTAHSGADPCATDPAVTHFAFVQCDADLDGTFDLAAGDSWIEVATLSFEVYAPAQMPTITRDDDVCNYTITEACTGDVLDMTSTNAAPGDDPAAITVNVTTANNCMGSFMVDPELCPAPGCTASASTIATTDPTRICVDGIGDPIDVSIDVAGMGTGAWVITDDMNIILALPPAPPFDLDGAGPGTCLIWYVNSDDAAFDPMVGDDAAAIVAASSCAFLSNPITVDRIEVTAPTISSAGPSVICADDGIPDLIPVDVDDAGIGASSAWVITDAAGIILALPPAPPFDLEGAGAGTCLIWLVNFDDPDFSPMAGDNAAAVVAAATCAVLSTPISVEREINCGVCEEEVTYNVFAPSCDMTGAVIELFDAGGTSLGTMPLGSEGGNGTFGLQPCGNYTMAIMGAPACYTDAGGEVGPIAFTTDGGGISNQTFTTIVNDIPTVGEWGLIILGLLMSITAVVGIRQRREEEVYG